MKLLVVAVIACAVICVQAKPSGFNTNEIDVFSRDGDFDGTITECHGIPCPAGSVGCSKMTKTSPDKLTLLSTIQCEDINGNVLNSASKSTENPFDGTQISSFSFTGHYNFRGGNTGPNRPTYTNTMYSNNNDDVVETFA